MIEIPILWALPQIFEVISGIIFIFFGIYFTWVGWHFLVSAIRERAPSEERILVGGFGAALFAVAFGLFAISLDFCGIIKFV